MSTIRAIWPAHPVLPKGALEEHHQAAVVSWFLEASARNSALGKLIASANGGLRPYKIDRHGRRYSTVGKKLQATGVESGTPDLQWPKARGRYHGLWIEMKRPENKAPRSLSPEQVVMFHLLNEEGYCATWANSAEEAVLVIQKYWNLGPFEADGGNSIA